MNNSLFTSKNVIIQGITGTHGQFHAAAMQKSGTKIIAGTSPKKAGELIEGVPVYASIEAIQRDYQVNVSVIFVPPAFAKAAMLEAIAAKVPLIICITEGVPIHDMLIVRRKAEKMDVTLIGPNCPGVLLPGCGTLGIIPPSVGLPGSVGIVSRSGTLTYEVAAALTARGIGQKYVIGIGGDPVKGTDFTDCLKLFENDPGVTSIVLIGEVGGNSEHNAADYIKNYGNKPVFAYVAGHIAPPNVQLGHAGAILGGESESAAAKTTALRAAGATTADSIVTLANLVK